MSNSFYIQPYLDTLSELDDNADFVRCESFDGTHVCYKLRDDLYDPEQQVRYEFLFEFDTVDYGYGIYYGCKCIFLNGDDDELQRKVDLEWSQLREGLTTILNNTFPGKDFLKRAMMMEHPINHHYWPFWIKLVEDESIGEIASKVLKEGIYFIYKTHLSAAAHPSGKVSGVPNSVADLAKNNTFNNSETTDVFILSGSHYTDGNSEMSPSVTKREIKKSGPKTDTSIVPKTAWVEDPKNPRNNIEFPVDKDKFICECRQIIAGETNSARLRCLFQLLCEVEVDSFYKIYKIKTLKGKDQYTKFCREIVGIKDEDEVKKTAEIIRKAKTWRKYVSEYNPEIIKMYRRLGAPLP